MLRFIAFVYGVASYLAGCAALLYAIGFLENVLVPKNIDSGDVVPLTEAIVVNVALMALFAVQHSVMARPQFKAWWTKIVPKSVERSTYVLFAGLALLVLFVHWRPIPAVVWQIANPNVAMVVTGVSFFGWVLVFASTFMINHFELFGLHQVAN